MNFDIREDFEKRILRPQSFQRNRAEHLPVRRRLCDTIVDTANMALAMPEKIIDSVANISFLSTRDNLWLC